MRASDELDRRLGEDLAALVAELPVRLVAARALSSRPEGPDRPCAYRLELADGSVLQGRRLGHPRRARLVERLTRIAGPAFPEPIARRGKALLSPWVEGELVAALASLPLGLVERAGGILASLHDLPIPEWRTLEIRSPADLARQLEQDLADLVAAGAVTASTADRARGCALGATPAESSLGVVHGDFCAENLVVTADGALIAIDNATLTFAPHDLDLARTWHRWPMTPEARDAFLDGYERRRSPAGFLERFRFWAVVALAGAAANRLRSGVGGLATALGRLEALLAAGESGADLWRRR